MRICRRSRGSTNDLIWLTLLSFFLHTTSVKGQVAETSEPSYTLHVYEDLVQVPALILTAAHGTYSELSPEQFDVRFDGGPVSHPSDVRLEGNDPVSLVLLLDVSHEEQMELAKSFAAEPELSTAGIFTSNDRVSVFADDCNLVRSLQSVPASLSALRAGVAKVLASPTLHTPGQVEPHCGERVRIWDVMATTILELGKQPGRRVLIVATDGLDRGSTQSAEEVRRLAIRSGVTVFAIRRARPTQAFSGTDSTEIRQITHITKDDLDVICDGTGGLNFTYLNNTIASTVPRVMVFLRERYILDFLNPSNITAGDHRIDVTVPDPTAFVRVSGAVFPLRDRHDPSTMPSDLFPAPERGGQKPKSPE